MLDLCSVRFSIYLEIKAFKALACAIDRLAYKTNWVPTTEEWEYIPFDIMFATRKKYKVYICISLISVKF